MNTELHAALDVLKKGGLILYPTDTLWAVGCDATNGEAVERLLSLKKRTTNHTFMCLVNDFKMLNEFVEAVPEVAYDILKYAERPTTVIYDQPIRVAENLINKDNTLGFRVAKDDFCKQLTRKLRRPVVATHATFADKKAPQNYKEIGNEILDSVDYVVNLQKNKKPEKPAAIIKLSNDGAVEVIGK